MQKYLLLFSILINLSFVSCIESSKHSKNKLNQTNSKEDSIPSKDSLIVYQTDNLIIKKLSKHIYVHISYLDTKTFGKVPCNGMLVVNKNEGIVFDTPAEEKSSEELINFTNNQLKSKIIALIPTHFHKDCVGGILKFEDHNIPTYITIKTKDLMESNNQVFTKPVVEFVDSLTLNAGNKKVYARYFGEGHTKDNIIGYFPEDNAIFGGCLFKEVGASKGNLEDANTNEWSATVVKIKNKYPKARIVIPGHGEVGGPELFDYTIKLFEIK
ncbi:metallo-beta-lactamase class B [Flavobacterium flevense]|uniref:beta-lactamase n=1 Tax=Flavobacterium flevense TaxID=983 RepID=A0A4Y4AVQ3_9FLAO|nr:subclass B1 metallo-beta-lactamase [Flavobacterium flevense]GEC72298.1 beta-lactamase [Flavobacterium flevense]SHL65945.1 metallo-beta-lactamase class B [Flavobacterium flevense]